VGGWNLSDLEWTSVNGTQINPQLRLSERPFEEVCKDVCRVSPSGTKTHYQELPVAKSIASFLQLCSWFEEYIIVSKILIDEYGFVK
jgi:hypothetical protein